MKPEELFLAIGMVDSSRLMRSELAVQSASEEKTEENPMKNTKQSRILRRLLIAAALVSLLAVTAFALGSFLLFDSPEEMIGAIFGNETGFDHSQGSIRPDPYGGPEGIIVEPTFDRAEVDEDVIAQDVAPYVDPVGQSIKWKGYTLTVDAFAYDSATKCGFFTYLLENPAGVSGYKLQSTGEIWYEGRPDIVDVNHYGYAYILQEKTTDTCRAATYYFKWEPRRGDALELSLQSTERYTPEEFELLIADEMEAMKEKLTPEEVVEAVRQRLGEENFEKAYAGVTGEELAEQCYRNLTAWEVSEQMEAEGTSEVISIPLTQESSLPHITAGEGSVVVSPIAIRTDVTELSFLRRSDDYGNTWISADNIKRVAIRYEDGTEYVVSDGGEYVVNYAFALAEALDDNDQELRVLTMMFNRIIDIEKVSAVVLNDVELRVDG